MGLLARLWVLLRADDRAGRQCGGCGWGHQR